METIAGTLTPDQILQATQQALTIASGATTTIANNQFVFFAAFDGTNNDKNHVKPGYQSTNVGQLYDQVSQANFNNHNQWQINEINGVRLD